jgi:hypothetical protein
MERVKAYDFSPIVSIWHSTEGRSSQTFALMLRALYIIMSSTLIKRKVGMYLQLQAVLNLSPIPLGYRNLNHG